MNFIAACGLAVAWILLGSCSEPLPGTGQPEKRQTASDSAVPAMAQPQVTYRFDDFANLPEGFSDLFKPDGGSPPHYIAYMKDIDRAYFDMGQGNIVKAAATFAAIGNATLFEIPNDAAWAGHAESLCRAGDKAGGRTQLVEAQCSYQLLSYRQSCNGLDSRKSETDFPSACYREYCEAEILRPDYEQSATNYLGPEDRQSLDTYARHLEQIEGLCR